MQIFIETCCKDHVATPNEAKRTPRESMLLSCYYLNTIYSETQLHNTEHQQKHDNATNARFLTEPQRILLANKRCNNTLSSDVKAIYMCANIGRYKNRCGYISSLRTILKLFEFHLHNRTCNQDDLVMNYVTDK